MKHRSRRGRAKQIGTAIRRPLACMLLFGSLVVQAGGTLESALADVAQQLLDQDFLAAKESIKRAAAADRSGKMKTLQESVNAVTAMPECLIAPFRGRIGKEIRINFPEGAELVRIVQVSNQGDIKADSVRKVGEGTIATPRNFKLSDLPPGERFKLLGRDESAERHIMRGILAWEAEKTDAAKRFFAKAGNDLGKLLIDRVDQAVKERQSAAAREQEAAQEAAAERAYEAMLKTAGVESLRKDSDKMVMAIRRKRFSETDVTQIKHQLKLLNGELAKTKIAGNNQPVLKCLALVRPEYPLEVDQATLDKAVARLRKDNPKEFVKASSEVTKDGISLSFNRQPFLVNISALSGLPIAHLKFDRCGVSDLSPLQGMPLKSLAFNLCHEVSDLSPLRGMPLEVLRIEGARPPFGGTKVKDLSPLQGMPLRELILTWNFVSDLSPLKGMSLERLDISATRVEDLSPLKGMPLKWLKVPGGAKDLSPVNRIKGIKIVR